MAKDDFWDNLLNKRGNDEDVQGMFSDPAPINEVSAYLSDLSVDGAVESRLAGRKLDEGQFTAMQELTDSWKTKNAVQLPVKAGTKLQFSKDPSTLFAYHDAPELGAIGEAVEGRAASGYTTAFNDHVFLRFDDGVTRAIHISHLYEPKGHDKRSTQVDKIRVASIDALLGDFAKVGADTLVNRATRDLWSLKKEGEEYVIERLFDDEGEPIKA